MRINVDSTMRSSQFTWPISDIRQHFEKVVFAITSHLNDQDEFVPGAKLKVDNRKEVSELFAGFGYSAGFGFSALFAGFGFSAGLVTSVVPA